MKFKAIEFALREMRDTFGRPRVLAGLVIVGFLVGFVGPFGTTHSLPLAVRIVYWLSMIALTYGLGIFTAALVRAAVAPFRLAIGWRIAILGTVASVPILAVVLAVNALFLGVPVPTGPELLSNWASTLVIAMGIVMLHILFGHRPQKPDHLATDQTDRKTPPLLDRLAADMRGPLVRLSMQDHYVEVETARGTELILLRLSDAIKETEGTAGLQIHRSHWVARDQIAAVRRAQGKVVVETGSGTVLPVSRTFLPRLRDEGLLPK